jgi:hypothetical protein
VRPVNGGPVRPVDDGPATPVTPVRPVADRPVGPVNGEPMDGGPVVHRHRYIPTTNQISVDIDETHNKFFQAAKNVC